MFATPHRIRIIAVLMVVVATGLAMASSWGDSLVVDEVPHIGAGYSYVTKLDDRLNPEHPPLVKDIAALPLLFLNLDQRAFEQAPWTTDVNGQWNFGRTLIFNSGNDPELIKNVARTAVLLVFFWSACYFIWRWTRERYDELAAFIATILFAFSPTVLAHARLVTTDVAAATGVLVATYFFLRFLRTPTKITFLLSALTLGIAFLCKFNNALLGPYFLVAALLFGFLNRPRDTIRLTLLTALLGITAFVGVVWPVYALQTLHQPMARQVSDAKNILASQQNAPLARIAFWAIQKPALRAPGQWVLGLAMVAQRSAGGNTIYWMGKIVGSGGPLYFPIVYALKEPIAWWLLVVIAIGAVVKLRTRSSKLEASEEWLWLLWLAIYWAVSINSTLNIGIRHLLPVYPFTIMLVAGQLSRLAHRRNLMILIAILMGWYVFESISVFPSYLAYFNQIAGGPSGGHRYVADSNLDWGQDGKRLAQWVQEQHIARMSVDYFGWADLGYYLHDTYVWMSAASYRDAQDFIARNQTDGWVAISATFLQNNTGTKTFADNTTGSYRWLLPYTPVTIIGHSIFVYHITK